MVMGVPKLNPVSLNYSRSCPGLHVLFCEILISDHTLFTQEVPITLASLRPPSYCSCRAFVLLPLPNTATQASMWTNPCLSSITAHSSPYQRVFLNLPSPTHRLCPALVFLATLITTWQFIVICLSDCYLPLLI